MSEPISAVGFDPTTRVGKMDEFKIAEVPGENQPDFIKLAKDSAWEAIIRFMNGARVNINSLLREYGELVEVKHGHERMMREFNELEKKYRQLKHRVRLLESSVKTIQESILFNREDDDDTEVEYEDCY